MPSRRRWRLRTMTGSKLASRSAGDLDLDRPDLGQHGFGAGAVAGVPAVAARGVVGRRSPGARSSPPPGRSRAPSWSTPSATRPGRPARPPPRGRRQRVPGRAAADRSEPAQARSCPSSLVLPPGHARSIRTSYTEDQTVPDRLRETGHERCGVRRGRRREVTIGVRRRPQRRVSTTYGGSSGIRVQEIRSAVATGCGS